MNYHCSMSSGVLKDPQVSDGMQIYRTYRSYLMVFEVFYVPYCVYRISLAIHRIFSVGRSASTTSGVPLVCCKMRVGPLIWVRKHN